MKNYTSFYGGEKKSFYGFFIQNTSEERVLKRGPSQTVSFNAEKLVQLLSLTVDFYPIQSGNGQSSPENIRAISGRTFADVCISPTLEAGDGKIYHVVFPTQVGTAYGGTIDMINKTLTINYLYKTFTGQENWEIYFPPRTTQYCRLVLGEHGSVINDSGICSHFPQKLINSSQSSIEDGQRIINSSAIPYAIICIRYVEKQKTVDEFKDWLREQYNAGTPVQVAYKISNPIVYNINIDSVTLYPNNNNIWIENGDITIQYKINKNVYYNTVNGNPCILDESVNISITNLLLNIQPVQDLHGYDAPWPDGARNKLNVAAVLPRNVYIISSSGAEMKPSNESLQWRSTDYIPVTPGETLYFGEINATASAAGTAFYDSTKTYLSGFSTTQLGNAGNIWTVPANAVYMRHSFRIDSTYNTNWETTVYIVLNSDQHVWYPYSNICPITGWTEAKVTQCGKNLLKPGSTNFFSKGRYVIQKSVVPKGRAAIMSFRDKDTSVDISNIYIGFVPDDYYSTGDSTLTTFHWAIMNGRVASNTSNAASMGDIGRLLTDVAVYPKTADAVNRLFARYDIQVELGSTATAYEPYQGETYSVEFPSEAGTVYGGTLDVTRGLLTVDRAMIASYAGEALPSGWISDQDVYAAGTAPTTGAQVVYELASPVVYPLMPTQINALDKLTILTTDVDNITATYKAKNK